MKGFPKSQGFEVILVVVDWLTKYAHFVPVSHPYTAAMIASLYMSHIFKLHGMPASIVSDKDATFTSLFWFELFWLHGTDLANPLHITLNQMGRQRLSMKAWNNI